jgi:predicted TPR repeat methyltransferase
MSEYGSKESAAGRAGLAERYEIRFPQAADRDQDQEWCEVRIDGATRPIRFHDYAEIYALPGLYEQLFYDELECNSPDTVANLLCEHLDAMGSDCSELDVFDVGAGNGMVAEELQARGVRSIVGVDIIEAAGEAAERDRPGAYNDYFVVDLTDMPGAVSAELEARRFNCLITVAALGFGDIPPEAFAAAFNLIEPGGTIAFTIKEDFISDDDQSGFSRLVDRALEDGTMKSHARQRYRHRLSMSGEPLHYAAMIAEKHGDLPLA